MRHNNRNNDTLRDITITRHYTKHAEGSVLVEFGDTKVLCTASISAGVPRFLKDSGQGWLTAEYGMLPRSTHSRMNREASRGKQSGRTLEIQRLIGRSLRCAVDMEKLGENTIYIDCDVIQADGGTRTASITGGCVALYDALHHLHTQGLEENGKTRIAGKALPEGARPDGLVQFIGSVSVGICESQPILDLDYIEDSSAETDMNVVMTESGEFIEVQGTAEGKPFHETELNAMLALAKSGIAELIEKQKDAVSK